MKVGIYTNPDKDSEFEVTAELVGLLKTSAVEFYLCKNHNQNFEAGLKEKFGAIEFIGESDYRKLDLMITVGGDGTVLSVAKSCLTYDIPILPINKGTKGFLNEVELDTLGKVVDVVNGNYRIDRRILISVTVKNREYLALNEVYITRRNSGKMVRLNSVVDGRLVDKYFCDGLLVCTPTGSTAYSLSAGGPIISPNASVMCLNPVNSHCLRSRPIVIGDDEQIEIGLDGDYDDVILMVDGIIIDDISSKDKAYIKKSEKHVRFFRLSESSFYSKLLDKLNGLI